MTRIDEPLPFTEQRGRLHIAPIGAALPLHVAKDGVFGDGWPQAWIFGGETDPEQCSTRHEVDTEQIEVVLLAPLRRVVTAQTMIWTFGLDRVSTAHTPWASLPPLPESQVPGAPRFMLGWESEDKTSRVIARQVMHDLGTMHRPSRSSALFLTYRLERAEKPLSPLPTPPVWRRLLNRLLRRRPPMRIPDLHPPFEVYRVLTLDRR